MQRKAGSSDDASSGWNLSSKLGYAQGRIAKRGFGAQDPELRRSQQLRKKHIKKMKDRTKDLSQLEEHCRQKLRLLSFSAWLSMLGLGLTGLLAELCRVGFIPSEEELRDGLLIDPYADENSGCRAGKNVDKLWSFQAFITFSTLLLAMCVSLRTLLQHRERELTIVYIASHSDPPDITIISHAARRRRLWRTVIGFVFEMLFTVLAHPLPGFRYTVMVQAVERLSKYEFESFIVIFMLPRIWHVWLYIKQLKFDRSIISTTYMLGDQKAVLAMLRHWDEIDHTLAVKVFFREHPSRFVLMSFLFLLLCASYCIRVFESPNSTYHSTWYWNHLWLVVVTMSTVGYGDNVPATHFGRFICVMVMAFGTVIVSMMTASATEFLSLNSSEEELFRESQVMLGKRRVTICVTQYMQYLFRVKNGYCAENWKQRAKLRHNFWRALNAYKNSPDYVDVYLGRRPDRLLEPQANRDDSRSPLQNEKTFQSSVLAMESDRETDKRKSIEQTEQTVGLDDRLAGEDGEEAVQSEDKASGGAEGEGAARRVSRSERDNRERPGGMQRWGDGERERRRKARQEEAKREQRAEQDFMSDVSPTGGSGTRRSEKQGHFERQAWQETVKWRQSMDTRVDLLVAMVQTLASQMAIVQADVQRMQERDLELRRQLDREHKHKPFPSSHSQHTDLTAASNGAERYPAGGRSRSVDEEKRQVGSLGAEEKTKMASFRMHSAVVPAEDAKQTIQAAKIWRGKQRTQSLWQFPDGDLL